MTTARVIPAKRSDERESSPGLNALAAVAGFPLTRCALGRMTSGGGRSGQFPGLEWV
jgi:hypothetical protein